MLALLSSISIHAQTVPVDVVFKMTELEKPDRPLAGVPVRLVVGEVANWQGVTVGHRFVTNARGEAKFTVAGVVDRRWQWVPYAMTGLSFPKRSDHVMIAVELEQLIPAANGEYRHYQWLHTLDLDCYAASECSNSGITAVYSRDAKGNFTQKAKRGPATRYGPKGLIVPELNGMVLDGPGYRVSGFFLRPANEARTHWKVEFTLQRSPAPTLR